MTEAVEAALISGFLMWMLQFVVAAVIGVPTLFMTRKRLDWGWRDLMYAVVPFLFWFFCITIFASQKSLSNYLIEPALIGLAAGIGFAAAAFLSSLREFLTLKFLRPWLLLFLSVNAITMAAFFPYLPE